jgi:exosortase
MSVDFAALQRDVFLVTVLALVLLERFRAIQARPVTLARRWPSNIGLFVIGIVVGTLVLPAGTYAFALQQPPGVLTRLGVPFAAQLVVTFVLLDFWKYWEHRLYHAMPLLWRLHLAHHSDTALDVTTSERHHPVEIVLGIATLAALVWVLGLPAVALALYVLVATVIALYSHANLRLPALVDHPLSRVLVTGPVHAVHHSDLRVETDSNFGSVFTVWDRVFGTFTEPAHARIPHIGLAYFHRPVDTGLWGVLLQPLRFRRDLDYPARTDDPIVASPRARRAGSAWNVTTQERWILVAAAIGAALVLVALWPTVIEMTRVWRSESYQYAWLVIPMLIYVIGWHDETLRSAFGPRPGMAGVWVAAAAGIAWSIGALATLDVLRQLALVAALHGVALAMLGWRCYRRFFPALALLFFMVPAGDLLQPALRVLTLRSLELVAWLAQLPHAVDGFVLTVGARRYIVVDECAGLSYVTLAAFLGYSFGLLLYGTFLRSAALALAGAAIGVACNVIRVNAIVLIDWMRDSQLDLTAHGTLQWVMLLAALGCLLYLLARSRPARPATGPTSMPAAAAPARGYAPLGAGACAAALALTTAALTVSGATVRHDTLAFPSRLAGFDVTGAPSSWTLDRDGQTVSARARYARDERTLDAVVVETRYAEAKLVESTLAPGDATTWREKAVGHERGCSAGTCRSLMHVTWKKEHGDELVHAYFVYASGPQVTDSRLRARVLHGMHRLMGGRDPASLVALVSTSALDPNDAAAALERLHASLREADGPAESRAPAP